MSLKLLYKPVAYGDGVTYTSIPNESSADFTLTRATNATRINEDGFIEIMTSNIPRLDYSGGGCPTLLLEKESTNLINYSEDFDDVSWLKLNGATVESEKVLSPDGNTNAYQVTFDGTNRGRLEKIISGVTSGLDYTVSVFARVSNGTQEVFIGSSASDSQQTLTTEWKRIYFTEAENDTTGYSRIICDDATTIELWGFQLEQSSHMTSYIPTTGNQETRNADFCKKENLSTDIMSSSYPFTMYVEAKAVITSGFSNHCLTFGNISSSSHYYSIGVTDSGLIFTEARANAIGKVLNSSQTVVDGEVFKAAVTMESETSGKIAVNGVVNSKTNFTNQAENSNINDIILGTLRSVSDTGLRIPIREVKLFNTALTEQELIDLTT